MSHKLNSKKILLFLVAIVAAITVAAPALYVDLFDDAYIHGRLADNLIGFGEPFFNRGEKFKAGSSTGYIYLLGAISKTSNLSSISSIRALESAVIFLSVLSIFWLSYVANQNYKKNLAIAIAILPSLLWAGYGGMETPIVCLLVIWSAIAYCYKKDYLSLFLIALATLFRFEIIVLWFALCLFFLFKRRKIFLIFLSSIPFFVLAFLELTIFGSMIPYAAKVKSVSYGLPISDSVFNALSFSMGKIGLILGILITAFFTIRLTIIFLGRFKIYFEDVYFGFAALVLLVWAFSKSMIFPWYFCLLVVPVGVGFMLDKTKFEGNKNSIYAGIKTLIILGFCIVPLRAIFFDHSSSRVENYLKIGSNLYSYCDSCTLVTSEIGGLGYSFKGVVYDAFGLGDPGARSFHPMKVPEERQSYYVGAIPPQYVVLRNPDFIISMPVFSQALMQSMIIETYHAYNCPLKLSVFGDNMIQVFSKVDIENSVLLKMGCYQSLSK